MQDQLGKLLTKEVCRQLKVFSAAVAVGTRPPELEMDWIHHDLLAGYRQAADHLAEAGRRRPAIFLDVGRSGAKIEAFLGRCGQQGMSVSDASAIDFHYDGQLKHLTAACKQGLESRFPGEFPFDALICVVDEVAGAAMAWLRGKGLRVPDDVAVIGCNNALFSESMMPPLASIERRDEEVAGLIEEMIFSRLADAELPARRREIAMQFVWRESAGGKCSTSFSEVMS
jgi:DNA-binding LacI/PurR family transcriptional regulator